jgi:hypothetical protein
VRVAEITPGEEEYEAKEDETVWATLATRKMGRGTETVVRVDVEAEDEENGAIWRNYHALTYTKCDMDSKKAPIVFQGSTGTEGYVTHNAGGPELGGIIYTELAPTTDTQEDAKPAGGPATSRDWSRVGADGSLIPELSVVTGCWGL